MPSPPTLIATDEELSRAAVRWRDVPCIALDLEASGMHAYRAQICTIQIATGDETAIIDALEVSIAVLGPILAESGPRKIVHDVGFDARLLAEARVPLGNVHDTALAASFLGKKQTGLDALLRGELEVAVDKHLQHHDWRKRPLGDPELFYLAEDVAHLAALEAKLFDEVAARGIGLALEEETRYRLGTAAKSITVEVPPPYVRMVEPRMPKPLLAVLRELASAREEIGRTRDVPVQQVLRNDEVVFLAERKPKDARALLELLRNRKKQLSADEARALVAAIARADGLADVPADERTKWLTRPRVDPVEKKLEKERHTRLSTWRRTKAKEVGVEEQVILPGHVLRRLAEAPVFDAALLQDVPGLGAFRVESFGAELVAVLRPPSKPALQETQEAQDARDATDAASAPPEDVS